MRTAKAVLSFFMEKIEFVASLPPIQSAIQLDGLEGARIKIDVSEEGIMEVLKMTTLKGKSFKVTITDISN